LSGATLTAKAIVQKLRQLGKRREATRGEGRYSWVWGLIWGSAMIVHGVLQPPRKPSISTIFFPIAFLGGFRRWSKKSNSASGQNDLLLEEQLFLSRLRYAD
jgi:hypothetical protein